MIISNIRYVATIAVFTSVACFLTACQSSMSYQDDQLRKQHCANASVLITDLTQSAKDRVYQLSDGDDCTGVVNVK